MDLNNLIPKESAQSIIAINAILTCILALLVFWQVNAVRTFKKKWGSLLRSSGAANFEDTLEDLLKSQQFKDTELQLLKQNVKDIDARLLKAIQKVGYIRFDAFPDVGGEQSFALAILDHNQNGVIITSLVGRSDCRTYCKPIAAGTCSRQLTKEEVRAIELSQSSEDSLKITAQV